MLFYILTIWSFAVNWIKLSSRFHVCYFHAHFYSLSQISQFLFFFFFFFSNKRQQSLPGRYNMQFCASLFQSVIKLIIPKKKVAKETTQ